MSYHANLLSKCVRNTLGIDKITVIYLKIFNTKTYFNSYTETVYRYELMNFKTVDKIISMLPMGVTRMPERFL